MKFNTAIAAMMSFVNSIYSVGSITLERGLRGCYWCLTRWRRT